MKIGFFIVFILLFLLINSFVILRGWQVLSSISNTIFRTVYVTTMILLFLSLVGSMIFGYVLPLHLAKLLSFVGFTYIIIFIYLLLSFLIVDIVRIFDFYLHLFPIGMVAIRMWAMVLTLSATAIALIVGNYNFNHPQVVTLNLKSDKPLQNKEIKIVAVSDIHLGISIDKKYLKQYVELINEQKPDLVLMAGDISDRLMEPIIRQNMDEEFRAIKAPMGVYAINGNHEHYAETPESTATYLQKAGIIVLRDEILLVDGSFYVVGREDLSYSKRMNLFQIVNGLDKNKPLILMDHQPYHLEEAEQNNIDFQISGHTHNGQFFPGNLFVKSMYEIGYGYLKKGNTHIYVSSGLGLWGPQYRIGTQSEVVVINFKF